MSLNSASLTTIIIVQHFEQAFTTVNPTSVTQPPVLSSLVRQPPGFPDAWSADGSKLDLKKVPVAEVRAEAAGCSDGTWWSGLRMDGQVLIDG